MNVSKAECYKEILVYVVASGLHTLIHTHHHRDYILVVLFIGGHRWFLVLGSLGCVMTCLLLSVSLSLLEISPLIPVVFQDNFKRVNVREGIVVS